MRSYLDFEKPVAELDSKVDELRALADACRIEVPEDLPPIACLVGYFGYETIGLVETLPRAPQSELMLPDMLFARPTLILVFDRLSESVGVRPRAFVSDTIPSPVGEET